MLKMILIPMLALTLNAHAQTPAPVATQYPACAEAEPVAPCQFPAAEAPAAFADMLLGNPKGYALLTKKTAYQRQNMSSGFMLEHVRLILLKQSQGTGAPGTNGLFKTTLRYEAILNDCRGTDACGGHYLFTADETTESDGYVSQSKFVNSIAPTKLESFDQP